MFPTPDTIVWRLWDGRAQRLRGTEIKGDTLNFRGNDWTSGLAALHLWQNLVKFLIFESMQSNLHFGWRGGGDPPPPKLNKLNNQQKQRTKNTK